MYQGITADCSLVRTEASALIATEPGIGKTNLPQRPRLERGYNDGSAWARSPTTSSGVKSRQYFPLRGFQNCADFLRGIYKTGLSVILGTNASGIAHDPVYSAHAITVFIRTRILQDCGH